MVTRVCSNSIKFCEDYRYIRATLSNISCITLLTQDDLTCEGKKSVAYFKMVIFFYVDLVLSVFGSER